MKYEVEFLGLDLDVSIARNAKFEQGYFKFGNGGGIVDPETKQVYPPVRSLVVHGEIETPDIGRELYEPLDAALFVAEELLTGIVATTQANFSFRKPIRCIYNGVEYESDNGFWREPASELIGGGKAFIHDLRYLDEPKNFHPKYHFYRALKDESNTRDYRLLNGWRFLEAHFGEQGKALKPALKSALPGLNVDKLYTNYRCAVAHASDIYQDIKSDRVVLPRYIELAADGDMFWVLHDLIDRVDCIVAEERPIPIQTER